MLAPHNAGLEQNGALEASLWDEWLWGSDPSEPYSPDVLMNRNQLLGLLVCRFKGQCTHNCFQYLHQYIPIQVLVLSNQEPPPAQPAPSFTSMSAALKPPNHILLKVIR